MTLFSSPSDTRQSSRSFLIWVALGIAFSKLLPLSSGGDVTDFLWNGVCGAGTVSNVGNYTGRVLIAALFMLLHRRFERNEASVLFTAALLSIPVRFSLVLAYYQNLFDPQAMALAAAFINGACQMIVETPLYVLLARHASFKGAALCIAAGTVGYTVLTQIANLIPSYHVQLAILAFAPSGTLLFWAVARRSAACVPDALDADTAVAPRQSSRRLLVVLVLACVARSLLRVLGSSKTWEGSGVFPLAAGPVGPASLTAICLACLALVYLVFCLPGRRPLRSCTLGLIVVVGSLQVAAIGETLDLLPVAFVTATISACELFSSVLVWVAFFDCIRYARASPWRARGLMVICETLCTVATMRLLPDGMSSSVVVMIFLYATVAVLLALEKTDGAADAVDAAGEAPAEAQDTQSYDAAVQAFANRHRLSPREQDVLPLLLAGHTRTEVIAETNLSDGTIRTHITNIHKKVGVHSREELVGRFEAEEGLPVPGKQL